MLKLPGYNLSELPGKFPDAVLKEAKKAVFRDEVFRDREEVKGFTIDDIESADLDDAIWLEKIGRGWRVQVTISDVDTLVRKDSYIDLEALSRVHTHYFPAREQGERTLPRYSIPMLPHVLSDYRLSLREGQLRPTITVEVTLSPQLKLLGIQVKKTALRSLRRLGLREYAATRVIGDPGLPLWNYYQLARGLNSKRWSEGQGIAFQELSEGIRTNEDGVVEEGSLSVSSLVVQEFMVLANHAVGILLRENRRLAPFRNHLPDRRKAPTRQQIIAEIERTSDYLQLVDNLRSTYNKFLGSARYEAKPGQHFGIGLPVYIHFTSPIRRYADLVAHRVVKALIDGERPPYRRAEMIQLCSYLNQRARRLATLRSIQSGTNSLHNYRSYGHLLQREKKRREDFVVKLLDFLKEHRIGNAFFEFSASDGFNIELTCRAAVRFEKVRHQVLVTARADKQTVKNEAARLLYRKIRSLVAGAGKAGRGRNSDDRSAAQAHRPHSESKTEGPLAEIYQYCQEQNLETPTFHYECWSGGPGPISCHCRLSEALRVTGYGETREASRRAAAAKMLEYLKSGQRLPYGSIKPPPLPPVLPPR